MFSVVLLPASLILALFGTNFDNVPLFEWPAGFWAMVISIFLVCGAILLVFRLRRWI